MAFSIYFNIFNTSEELLYFGALDLRHFTKLTSIQLLLTLSLTFQIVIDTLFLCISEDQYMNGDEGQWKSSALLTSAQLKVNNRSDKETIVLSEVPELTPINAV